MPISEVTCEDNMVMMARYPDKFFDLAIPDAPYFSWPEKRRFYGFGLSSKNIARVEYKPLKFSWKLPDDTFFFELKRTSLNTIIWGANYFPQLCTPFKSPKHTEYHSFIKTHPRGWIIWDKINYSSTFADCELAYTSFDRPTVIYSFMWNGMLQGRDWKNGKIMQGNKNLNEKRIHPTQKPMAVYTWLLKNYAKPGDKILDTHLGSGSSRIAAYKLGFDFWATELDKDYFDAQEKRFKKETDLGLFDPAILKQINPDYQPSLFDFK